LSFVTFLHTALNNHVVIKIFVLKKFISLQNILSSSIKNIDIDTIYLEEKLKTE